MRRPLLFICLLSAGAANVGSMLLLSFACLTAADTHPVASLCAYVGGLAFLLYLMNSLRGVPRR